MISRGREYIRAAASWGSVAATTANTAQQIIAAASNVNGCLVHRAGIALGSGAAHTPICSMLYSTGTPANVVDGAVIAACNQGAGAEGGDGIVDVEYVYIPPGHGLFFISDLGVGVDSILRHALYTLL